MALYDERNPKDDALRIFTHQLNLCHGDEKEPLLLENAAKNWPCRRWTLSKFASLLGDKKLKFRIGPHRNNLPPGTVLWEGGCAYQEATLKNFEEWCQNTVASQDNPLNKFHRDHFWCYADYKYMKDLFQNQPDVYKDVPWESLGLKDLNGEQSTVWIGSIGAHTVCHQDSYGFNIVAQIQGRKKWYLFPPEQTACLYPTRIPFEESSVFSEVNITNPDLTKHPKFQESTPFCVVLKPGDVLYVPKHWWHFVECEETSISINCWVDLESDHLSRVHEAVTRMLVFHLLQPDDNDIPPQWLNPTEELTSHRTNLMYLETSLKVYQQLSQKRKNRTANCETGKEFLIEEERTSKTESLPSLSSSEGRVCKQASQIASAQKRKADGSLSRERITEQNRLEGAEEVDTEIKVTKTPCTSINEIIETGMAMSPSAEQDNISEEPQGILDVLTQCVTDPRVVSMVTELLLEKLENG